MKTKLVRKIFKGLLASATIVLFYHNLQLFLPGLKFLKTGPPLNLIQNFLFGTLRTKRRENTAMSAMKCIKPEAKGTFEADLGG